MCVHQYETQLLHEKAGKIVVSCEGGWRVGPRSGSGQKCAWLDILCAWLGDRSAVLPLSPPGTCQRPRQACHPIIMLGKIRNLHLFVGVVERKVHT